MGEAKLIGLVVLQQTFDVVNKIQERIKTTLSKQKSNADIRPKNMEFAIQDKVFFKVAPMKGSWYLERKGS